MKYIYIIVVFVNIVNSFAQNKNQLLVEYSFKNIFFENKETLLVKNDKIKYIIDAFKQKKASKTTQNKERNFTIISGNVDVKERFIYSNLTSNNLIMTLPNKDFFVADSVNFNWKITADTMQIGKYNCTKALLNFRGRNYEAYFTEEIPISAGPWKFKSLPGLILYIKSTSGKLVYTWSVTKIIYPYVSDINVEFTPKHNSKIISLKESIKIEEAEDLKNDRISEARVPKGVTLVSSTSERVGIELIYEWEKEK